jgi:hypothetical protein
VISFKKIMSSEAINNDKMIAHHSTLLDGRNVRLNWNIESDMNVNWIKFKNCLSLY